MIAKGGGNKILFMPLSTDEFDGWFGFLLIIKLMQLPPTREEVIQKSREYYKTLIDEAKPRAFNLNISLTSNPFIKDRDSFKVLKFQLADYNKRVEKGQVKDSY